MGPIVLTGLAAVATEEGLSLFRSYRGRGGYSTKVMVGVRADARATLVIRRPARRWVTLNYTRGTVGMPAVTFEACSADQPAFSYDGGVGPATGFAGGFRLSRPGCVPLEVRVAGEPPVRATVPFGVGRC